MPIAAPSAAQSRKPAVQKLLICAPSNAAIDEIAKRLTRGVYGSRGQNILPKVVRVGSESQINISVKDISLDSLVEAMINADGVSTQGDTATEINSLRNKMEAIKASRQALFEELETNINPSRNPSLAGEIQKLNAERANVSQKLDYLRDKQKSQNRHLDATRRRYRYEILAQADIICSTLSGSGHEQLEPFDFPMVIIDEAAQSIELSSLIPLKYRCTRCVMVGGTYSIDFLCKGCLTHAGQIRNNYLLLSSLRKHPSGATINRFSSACRSIILMLYTCLGLYLDCFKKLLLIYV